LSNGQYAAMFINYLLSALVIYLVLSEEM